MANFNLQANGFIYLVQWIDPQTPLKISTKIKIDPLAWNKASQQPHDLTLKDQKGVKIMDTLARYKGSMVSALEEVNVTGGNLKDAFYRKLSGELVRKRGSIVKQTGFLEYFDTRVLEFEATGKSNHKSYRTTYNNLEKYFKNKRPTFDELGMQFFNDFTTHMQKKPLEYSKNTIHCQWKNIKVIFGEAFKLKLHNNIDFKDFSVGTEVTSNVFLTLDELEVLNKLDLSDCPHLDRTRDYFIVGAFTGLRFSDWHRVATDLIEDGVLTLRANKTDETCQIPIHKYVKAVLDKHDGIMPPILSNQKMNDNLKTLCQKAEFNTISEKIITKGGKKSKTPDKLAKHQQVTTHTARRSFCTNAILQGASPYAVMQISGHKTLDSFDRYIKMTKILAVDNLKKLPMFQS